MYQLLYRIAELERRMSNLIRHGRVEQLRQQPSPRARVRSEELVTDWLPWMTQRAGDDQVWWQPSVHEQVLLLAPAGDLSQAIILPALWSEEKPQMTASSAQTPADTAESVTSGRDPNLHRVHYRDGTLIDYHCGDHRWTLDLRASQQGQCRIYTDQLTTDGRQVSVTTSQSVTVTAESLIIQVGGQQLRLDSSGATLTATTVNLGSGSGKGVARIGDTVMIASGSSAGSWPIVSGSTVVKAS